MFQGLIDLFNLLFVQPITNIIVIAYDALQGVGVPGAFGFAIIIVTLGIRMLMHPFFRSQMQTAKKMKEIKPKIDALSKKHKKDPQKLQQEQMRLYKEAGINPASGCLFALIQMPLIFALYQTLQLFLRQDGAAAIVSDINAKLYHPMLQITSVDPNFFIYNLATAPAQLPLTQIQYAIIPVLTGVLQYFQTKVTMPHMTGEDEAKKTDTPATSEKKTGKKEDKKPEPSTADEFQKAMGMQMKYIFPVMIGYFAYTLPVGLSLYWNTFSIFSIIQHYVDERRQKKASLVISNS